MVKYCMGGESMPVEYRYIDVIWLDNLVMNFLLLYMVRRIARNPAPIWRLWCSACLGALYAVLVLLPGLQFLASLGIKLALSALMLVTGYRVGDMRGFFRLLGFFYGATFLFGGAAFGLFYLTGTGMVPDGGVFIVRDFPVRLLLYATVLLILLCRWLWPVLLFKINHRNLVYKVELEFDGKRFLIDALLDTGNALSDPVSKSPVMLVDFDRMKSVMPEELHSLCKACGTTDFNTMAGVLSGTEWARRFRLIPYNTVGSSGGLIVAYKPDKARILINGSWKEISDIVVGVPDKGFASGSEYQALIQPQIIQ
ncbi:MAG TPA: sigma-E processing peptidase SpoIIGA [Candidatus Atribacteria bacterium]|nr:sigma-E processing peptidase SpoIIGA [Candidatus Atribacteria bacterium]